MTSRGRYFSGRGRDRQSGAVSNELSRSRASASSAPGHAPQNSTTLAPPQNSTTSLPPPQNSTTSLPPPQNSTTSLPPPSSVSRGEVPTRSAPSSSTPATGLPTAPITRLLIEVRGNSIVPSHQCSSQLRKIFEAYIECGGTTWKKVTPETKRIYHEEFCKRCRWDPIYDRDISRLYPAKAANCYSNMVGDWKRHWKHGGLVPRCLPDITWQHFLQYWGNPEVKKKSEQNSKNRLSEPLGTGTGISKHKAGSRSAQDHALAITKEKGEPASNFDVFVRMHRLDSNSQSCAKAKKIYDEVQEKVATITQSIEDSSESQPIDMSKLLIETAGIQKGRVFGIGNISKIYTNSNCHSSATSSITDAEISRRIDEKVEERVQAIRVEMESQMEQKMQVMMRAMMQDKANSPGSNSAAPTEGEDQNDIDLD